MLLIAAGFVILRILDVRTAERLQQWLATFPKAMVFLARLNPQRVHLLADAAFAYAALFITEGTGLWLQKK